MVRKQEADHKPPDGLTELMAHYGNAMLQVGKLEQEVHALREALQEATSRPDEHAGLLRQLEERNCEVSRQAETITILRLQIDNLNAQLDQLRGYTIHTNGTKYVSRRRHRRHRNHWWQFWRPRRHSRSSSSSGSSSEPAQVEQSIS